MHRIKCGHCSNAASTVYHKNAADVKACAQGGWYRPRRVKSSSPMMASARAEIKPMRSNEWNLKTPRSMVENMRDGRYAVEVTQPDMPIDWVFLRVSRPNRGKQKDCLVLQTQHSESYKPLLTIYPNGSVWVNQRTEKVDLAMLMVAADPYTAAINYGRELGCCSRCARELTDERSRYYSIGPECEKYWPEIINYIDETRGVFVQ